MFEGEKVRRNSKLVEEHKQRKHLRTVDRQPAFSSDRVPLTGKET